MGANARGEISDRGLDLGCVLREPLGQVAACVLLQSAKLHAGVSHPVRPDNLSFALDRVLAIGQRELDIDYGVGAQSLGGSDRHSLFGQVDDDRTKLLVGSAQHRSDLNACAGSGSTFKIGLRAGGTHLLTLESYRPAYKVTEVMDLFRARMGFVVDLEHFLHRELGITLRSRESFVTE